MSDIEKEKAVREYAEKNGCTLAAARLLMPRVDSKIVKAQKPAE